MKPKHWSIATTTLILGLAIILLWPKQATDKKEAEKVNESSEQPQMADVVEPPLEEPSMVGRAYPRAVPQASLQPKPTAPKTPLAILIGQTPAQYSERIVALNKLATQDLDEPTRMALFDYLRQPTGQPRNGREDLVEAAVKNNILNHLIENRFGESELTETLIAIANSPAQPTVMRDYALQHLGALGASLIEDETDNRIRQETGDLDLNTIEDALLQATHLREHSYAGTALLSLHRLTQFMDGQVSAEGDPKWNPETRNFMLRSQAVQILGDDQFSPLSRATALQLLKDLDSREALKIAGANVKKPAPIELRLAAIGVIASEADSLSALNGVSPPIDPRLKPAIENAREQIQARQKAKRGDDETI